MSGPEFTWVPGPVPGSCAVSVGQGRRRVDLQLMPVGRDWLLIITGGQAHAGAVALAGPGQETADLARGVHKEGPLARDCAAMVARATGRACAAVAGIHQDAATAGEIKAMVKNARLGTEALVSRTAVQEPGTGQR